jgi:rhodanese-related sulfurtransferase
MTATAQLPPISPDSRMSEILAAYPGAQRTLFAHYHIGGCSSCSFSPTETLTQLCQRNDGIDPLEAIAHIQASHRQDASILISPQAFDLLRGQQPDLAVLDIRTREEHEAVHIPNSQFLTQDLTQTIFQTWPKDRSIVLYDHTGTRVLDAAAYFIGHGYAETKALRGGIDAYSSEIDPSLPRYRIEMEA